MAVCRTHAVVVLPDVHAHWFPRVSRATVHSLVLSKAGSFGYPITRTECVITCTCATECARSTRVDRAECLRYRWSRWRGARIHFELLLGKTLQKSPLTTMVRKNMDCRETCTIATVVEYRQAAEHMQGAIAEG